MDDAVDVTVIGAGVVGCAVASRLAREGREVMVLEREARVGTQVTSRNSGVIHSGLYYPPDSLKAKTCIRGNHLLYRWAAAHGVAHRNTGKLVVARRPEELPALQQLHANAVASGAPDSMLVSPKAVAIREPALPPVAGGLWCPHSGIVDPHGLTHSLMVDAERHGAVFVPRTEVHGIDVDDRKIMLRTTRGSMQTSALVNAAGLFADRIASMVGLTGYRIHPCRGDYFRLRTERRYRHLIYPVRRPGDPGLGVHLTIDLDGSYRLGPDAHYIADKCDFSPAFHKHGQFLAAAQALLGSVKPQQLHYDDCGIRPKLQGPGDRETRDFVLEHHPQRCFHLLGIESPGLTAALALAEQLASRLHTAAPRG